MGAPIDLTGRVFGLWAVVAIGKPPRGFVHLQYWLCRCACGKELVRRGSQMLYAERQGKVQSCQSCGTKQQVTHGLSKTPEYKVWKAMIDRCENPNHAAYARYGGRGITVCNRWKSSFELFMGEMGTRPSPQHSIDRADNDKGYSPENCRWATNIVQNRNKTGTRLLNHKGKSQTVTAWAEELGISHAVIYQRLNTMGWSTEKALSKPLRKDGNPKGMIYQSAQQFTHNGKTMGLTEWARALEVPRSTLSKRLHRGWSVEKALGK
jgi:hypothetical protein